MTTGECGDDGRGLPNVGNLYAISTFARESGLIPLANIFVIGIGCAPDSAAPLSLFFPLSFFQSFYFRLYAFYYICILNSFATIYFVGKNIKYLSSKFVLEFGMRFFL